MKTEKTTQSILKKSLTWILASLLWILLSTPAVAIPLILRFDSIISIDGQAVNTDAQGETVTIRIYPKGADTALWQEHHTNTVINNGRLSLILGTVSSSNPLKSDFFKSHNDLEFSVTIRGREKEVAMLTVPYAFRSDSAKTADEIDWKNIANKPTLIEGISQGIDSAKIIDYTITNKDISDNAKIDFKKLNISKEDLVNTLKVPTQDTTLSEIEVDKYVENNGYLTQVKNENIAKDTQIDFAKLNITKADIASLGFISEVTLDEDKVIALIKEKTPTPAIKNEHIKEKINWDNLNISLEDLQSTGIQSAGLLDNTFDGAKIVNGTITSPKLAAGAITGSKINKGAITSEKIADYSIKKEHLNDAIIEGKHIKDNSIDGKKLSDQSIDYAKLNISKEDLVNNLGLLDTQLSENDIDTMATNKGFLKVVKNENVHPSGIDYVKLNVQNKEISFSKLDIRTSDLNALNITAKTVIDNAISNAKLQDSSISAAKLQTDSINSSHIRNDAVTTEKIALDAIVTNRIKAGAISTQKLADNAVTTEKIAPNAITAEKIKDASIPVSKLIVSKDDITALGIPAADTKLTETEVDTFVGNNGYLTKVINANLAEDILFSKVKVNNNEIPFEKLKITKENIVGLGLSPSTLTEGEVDAFVANNGYITSTLTESEVDAFVANNGYITSTLTESQVDAFVANNGYLTSALSESEVDTFVANNGYITSTLTESEVDAFVANNGYISEITTQDIVDLGFSTKNKTLTEEEVDAFVANNGYITSTLTESQVDAFVANNGYLTSALSESEVDAFVANNGYITSTLSESEVDAFVANNGYISEITTQDIVDLGFSTKNKTLTEEEVDAFVADNGYITSTLTESEVDAFVANNGYIAEITTQDIIDLGFSTNNATFSTQNVESILNEIDFITEITTQDIVDLGFSTNNATFSTQNVENILNEINFITEITTQDIVDLGFSTNNAEVTTDNVVEMVKDNGFIQIDGGDLSTNADNDLIVNVKMEHNDTTTFNKSVILNGEVGYKHENMTTNAPSITIDWRTAMKKTIELTQPANEITMIAPSNPGALMLIIKRQNSAPHYLNFSNIKNENDTYFNIYWPGGLAPMLSIDENTVDIITIYYDGSNYYGTGTTELSQ